MKGTPLLAALPCKHCGCEESSISMTGDDEIYVQCENLHCLARGPLAASPREAVAKWNVNLDAKEQPELEGVDQVDGDPDAGREALELLRRANNDPLWQGFCGRSSAFNPLPDDAGAELEGVDQVDGDPDDAGAVLEEGTDD